MAATYCMRHCLIPVLLIDIQPHANSYVNVVLATPEREMVLKKISSSSIDLPW